MRVLRFVVAIVLAGVTAWLARLLAHAKVPLPEGRWREVSPEEIGPGR